MIKIILSIKVHIKEFKCDEKIIKSLQSGIEVSINSFEVGDLIRVAGVSKGKGFAGHMKRHGFSGGRASHGKNSVMRKAGSVGAGTWPGKIWKGTKMAGRMGGENTVIANLTVVKLNLDSNLMFVSGSIPGPNKSIVYIEK